ncbi:hypothetical protein Cflav_PD2897 [Pedosphaera parvula Ellin514]|uniref:Uncharacterized protein n=1 Tax=Pedosphaera parvula (strain Ellin514) TaxID=320771 RepID=B9XMJ6_PEDPL|nr:hypothetical protein Cflav_PD2897 [Pedosphaera parvula Ellin514]
MGSMERTGSPTLSEFGQSLVPPFNGLLARGDGYVGRLRGWSKWDEWGRGLCQGASGRSFQTGTNPYH